MPTAMPAWVTRQHLVKHISFSAVSILAVYSFVRSLQAGVQPTLNPTAETSALAREEKGNWLVCAVCVRDVRGTRVK